EVYRSNHFGKRKNSDDSGCHRCLHREGSKRRECMMQSTVCKLDALQELVNIGGGHAATSVSKLVGRPIQMDVPTVEEMAYEEVFQHLRAEDEVVKAVLMKLVGNDEGAFLFVMSEESSKDWARLLFAGEENQTAELVESALKELVNI